MSRTSIFCSLLAVVVGAAAALSYASRYLSGPDEAKTGPPPRTTVVAFGRLLPKSGIIAVGGDAGRQIRRLLVKEGDMVKQGDILADLDNYPQMVASKDYAQSQLQSGIAQLKAKTALEQLAIAQAQSDIKNAQESATQEIKAQAARIDKITQKVAELQGEVKRLTELVKSGAAAKVDLARKKSDLNDQQKDLEAAQADLAKQKAAQVNKLSKAQNDLATAQANLQLAQATIDVESLRTNVTLAESRLEDTIIRAPVDGVILKLHRRPGESITSDPILRMADVSNMIAMTEVYETDVHLVRVGQEATVTASALPEPLSGKVVAIGRLVGKQGIYSDNPAAPTDARVVDVKVLLAKPELADRLVNLQTQVSIKIEPTAEPADSHKH